MTIWDSIDKARMKKGWSVRRMADEAGLSQNTVVGWIYQRNVPNVLLLWQLADALEVSMDELIGRDFNSIDKKK
jgi:transcriptional regulator with XRE-family HTH domain